MLRKLAKYWNGLLDKIVSWRLQPMISLVALLSGGFLTYSLSDYKRWYPNWLGPIRLVESNLPLIFISSALASFILSILVEKRSKTIAEMQNIIIEKDAEIKEVESNRAKQIAKITEDKNREIENKADELNEIWNRYSRQSAEIGNAIIIICEGLLLNLADKIGLDSNAQVRFSMYVHDNVENVFIPCGRYSRNPRLARPGRTSYPDDQGCIEKGWSNGWHFDNQVPKAEQAARRREYNQRHYNVPYQVTDNISMKSTLYAVKRLETIDGKAVAVLVVEAIDSSFFTEKCIRDSIEGSAGDYARIIHELKPYIPDPAIAKESGL